jgi:drug/metabolite transporter (DMT)-like permease
MLVVLLGLSSAVCWGVADFLGGRESRAVALSAVAIGSQLTGLVVCLLVLAVTRQGAPGGDVVAYAAAAGAANAIGLVAFYGGLAIGRMSVVAPIVGMSAVVPVAAGLFSGDHPSAVQDVGMVVAVLGIVLAARQEADATPRRPAYAHAGSLSIALAIVAAIGVGTNLLFVQKAVTATDAFPIMWVLATTRAVSLALLTAVALATRRPLRAATEHLPAIALLGLLDLAANVLYALATRQTLLSLAAVLASLHPVATVILARALLGERLRGVQRLGVVFAIGGAALIAAA